MDQHPIPQNVTGFQFKLIGKMTVKQFGYVAIGVIAAFITYYIPIGGILGVLIKIILLPLFGAAGAIIAFVPIDGRPIDVMAGNFLKAFFAPNQYIYRKSGVQFSFSKIKPIYHAPTSNQSKKKDVKIDRSQANAKAQELEKFLTRTYANKSKNPQDAKEASFLNSLLQPNLSTIGPSQNFTPTSHPAKTPSASTVPNQNQDLSNIPPDSQTQAKALEEKESALRKQLDDVKKEDTKRHTVVETAANQKRTQELEVQLKETHAQKQALEQEIANLKSQLLAQKAPVPQITQIVKKQQAPLNNKAHVRSIPADMNKKMGLIVSDSPNVIMGVVKDSRGNILPNILVEIKDQAENPVRAFKTNALGNFASATPLSPGEYVITLEDPKKQHTFDEIKISLSNQIVLPLEIISYDKREQLRKELFSQ